EAVGGAEDVTAVGEADEGLDALDRVDLGSDLERVASLDEGKVVVELDALVVVLDGNEERLAEAVAAAEVERGVGQGPVLAGDVGTVVRARRYSRANWKRNSLRTTGERLEMSEPLPACQ